MSLRSHRAVAPSEARWPVLVAGVVVAVALLFAAFALLTMIELTRGRREVERRVGWLREIGIASRALHECGEDRDRALERIADITAERRAPTSLPAAPDAPCDPSRIERERAQLASIESEIRAETGRFSAQLGTALDRLFAVAVGACISSCLLGITMISLVRARHRLAIAARALDIRAHEAIERDRTLRLAAAAIAHEINNPLLYLRLGADALRAELEDGSTDRAAVSELLDDSIDATDRIAAIARDLAMISRPESELALELVDVRDVIARTCRLVARPNGRPLELRTELEPVPRVRASASRLSQVFLNLMVNAQHAIEGVTPARIVVRLFARDGSVHVEIADTGAGVPAGIRERVFEPFFTTKAPGVGTGLGLHVSRTIVESFGGVLSLTPGAPRGTIATVVLPAVPERAEPAGSSRPDLA